MGAEEKPAIPPAPQPQWYVVRCQIGREESVRNDLIARIKALKPEGQILDVLLPTEKITEIRGGLKHVHDLKRFSGTILVRMVLNDDNQRVVCEIPGMGEFLSKSPMESQDVQRIMMEQGERPHVKLDGCGWVIMIGIGLCMALLVAGFVPWIDCPACGVSSELYALAYAEIVEICGCATCTGGKTSVFRWMWHGCPRAQSYEDY